MVRLIFEIFLRHMARPFSERHSRTGLHPDFRVMCAVNVPKHAQADGTVRMGELEPWIDENFVRSVWYNMGEQVNVKMIRDKFSG